MLCDSNVLGSSVAREHLAGKKRSSQVVQESRVHRPSPSMWPKWFWRHCRSRDCKLPSRASLRLNRMSCRPCYQRGNGASYYYVESRGSRLIFESSSLPRLRCSRNVDVTSKVTGRHPFSPSPSLSGSVARHPIWNSPLERWEVA